MIERFLSEDPIGFNSGDFNFYRYVKNKPINFVDPRGLFLSRFAIGFIIAGGGALEFLINIKGGFEYRGPLIIPTKKTKIP